MNLFKITYKVCKGEGEIGTDCPNHQKQKPLDKHETQCPYQDKDNPARYCLGQIEEKTKLNFGAIAIVSVMALLTPGIVWLIVFQLKITIPSIPSISIKKANPQATPIPKPTSTPTIISTPTSTIKPEEQAKLTQAEQFATIAENNMKNPQNITSLEQAKISFEKAIKLLESIPTESSITVPVQERLASYKADVTELNKRITEEKKAEQLLVEAKTIAEKATQDLDNFGKDGFQRISVLNRIKTQLQNALGKVTIISNDYPKSLAYQEALSFIKNYQIKINIIENKTLEIRQKCSIGDGISRIGSCLP